MAENGIIRLEPVGDLLNQQAINKLVAEGVNATYGNLHADIRANAFGLSVKEDGSAASIPAMLARANATTTAFDYFNPLRWVGINDNTKKSADFADNGLSHVLSSGKETSYVPVFALAGEFAQNYTYANPADGRSSQMKLTCDGTQSSSSPNTVTEQCKGFLYNGKQKIARVEQSVTFTSTRFVPSFSGLEDEDHASKSVRTNLFALDGRPIGTVNYGQSITNGAMDVRISTQPGTTDLH